MEHFRLTETISNSLRVINYFSAIGNYGLYSHQLPECSDTFKIKWILKRINSQILLYFLWFFADVFENENIHFTEFGVERYVI